MNENYFDLTKQENNIFNLSIQQQDNFDCCSSVRNGKILKRI
jgi:hypothetical protein